MERVKRHYQQTQTRGRGPKKRAPSYTHTHTHTTWFGCMIYSLFFSGLFQSNPSSSIKKEAIFFLLLWQTSTLRCRVCYVKQITHKEWHTQDLLAFQMLRTHSGGVCFAFNWPCHENCCCWSVKLLNLHGLADRDWHACYFNPFGFLSMHVNGWQMMMMIMDQ